MTPEAQEAFEAWMAGLEDRHLRDLTFQEVSRALRALSSCYVERRGRLASGAALEGKGKRAAFALFYAPLHFMVTAHVAAALRLRLPPGTTIVDLGCGTGAAGAAWALTAGGDVQVLGVDRHPWARAEAEWTWRVMKLRARAIRADVGQLRWPGRPYAAVAAFALNELPAPARHSLRDRLLEAARAGQAVLVIEPLARAAAPWWSDWVPAFAAVGGEERTWRFPAPLPRLVARLDAAVGLNHRELTARSLHVHAG